MKYVLDQLEPVCPYGVKRLKSGEIEDLERELDRVSQMYEALDKIGPVRDALSGLKDVSGTLRNCALGPLGEVELFELTAFVLRLKELIPLAEAYERFAPVDGALAVLDPSGSGRLSFYVEDSRSPELQRCRRAKREIEKRLRDPDDSANREELLARRLEAAKGEDAALHDVYAAMTEALRPHLPALEQNAAAAGRLDAAIAKALLARRFGAVRPTLGGETLILENARNPRIAERVREFVPVTVELPRGASVLTGANMGGKSVALQTVELNVSLALRGYFVFCDRAVVPRFDRIEVINRDFSDDAGGLSSFGGEIVRFNAACTRFCKEGEFNLLLLDEFARGTNAREGAAIVRGVVKYLANKNAVALLATHYDGAAEFAARHYQVRGLREVDGAATLQSIEDAMDYGLIPVERGTECPRDALRVCRLLGMDPELLAEVENEQKSEKGLDKV